MLTFLLLACTDDSADLSVETNPYAGRPVVKPEVCPDGPAGEVHLGAPGAIDSSGIRRVYWSGDDADQESGPIYRVAWRSSDAAEWEEIGRVEGSEGWAQVPAGGEVLLLGGGGDVECPRYGSDVWSVGEDTSDPDVEALRSSFLVPSAKNRMRCVQDVYVSHSDGSPAVGAAIYEQQRGERYMQDILLGWTDENGWAKRLPAVCRPHRVTAALGALGVIGDKSDAKTLELTLPEPNARLSGRVRSGEEPVVGAEVNFYVEDVSRKDWPLVANRVRTDVNGRWEADLRLPVGSLASEVKVAAEHPDYMREYGYMLTPIGYPREKYFDLTPARRIHLRCPGAPNDACDGKGSTVRCGPAGDLDWGRLSTDGPEGAEQYSTLCPDVPDLRVKLDGQEVTVFDDVAWFDEL